MDKKLIEITEKAIRSSKDNSGALVGLLNQEIEELQRVKEKQIEEMAQDICSFCVKTNVEETCQGDKSSYCFSKRLEEATYAFNLGYRKINENEVVISKEKYERLKSQRYIITPKQVKSGKVANLPYIPLQECEIKPIPSVEETRKETARAYHDKMQKIIHERDYIEGYAEIGLQEENDEIAKQFGVDLGE